MSTSTRSKTTATGTTTASCWEWSWRSVVAQAEVSPQPDDIAGGPRRPCRSYGPLRLPSTPVGGSSAFLRRLHGKPLGLLQCPAVTHDDNVAVKILSGLTTAWIFAASDSCWTY